MDGLGNFEFGINGPATKTDSSLQFDVTRTGNPFTGIGDVEEDGSGGNPATFFAAHIANSGNTNTGFAGVNDAPCTDCQQGSVPEPTSIALLGGVLLFTATRIRRRRRVV
jgi:hypothetical protein